VRHVRYYVLARRLDRWWRKFGHHQWLAPNELDLKYLDDVWNGRA